MPNDEWFTPLQVLYRAREVLGNIDLDPASNETAQENVRATRYFTKKDDGLNQPWHGKVWLNPPYSKGLVGKFVDKLLAEVEGGRVSEAIALVNNCTDTKWFARAARAAAMTCFWEGRIKFITPEGEAQAVRVRVRPSCISDMTRKRTRRASRILGSWASSRNAERQDVVECGKLVPG